MKRSSTFYLAILTLVLVFLSAERGWTQQQEAVFNFTGDQQSFLVPPGVTTIHIQAWGAQGSNATFEETGLGGLGGFAEGDLAVTPGQTLEIFVGGRGLESTGTLSGGGFNGGGDAFGNAVNTRGGGGGASDVRAGGTTFNDRVIVAAGGGGASASEIRFGGDGGGLTGGDGGGPGSMGDGGTQIAGGQGGSGVCLDGEFGLGGSNTPDGDTGCAGGGGGWFGGGAGTGAGGGSSFIDGVENGITTPGVREGDGLVIIKFTPGPRPIPTLSEWGLIAMAGVLGFIGIMVLRRRKAAA